MILHKYDDALVAEIAEHYKKIIELIGENPEREGLKKTPIRAAKALLDVTRGYKESASGIIKSAIFEHAGSNIVIVKDIEFYSLCEHHLLPFFGTISIGYIPDGKIVGLSKLARLVNSLARRFQVQERLTVEVCNEVLAILGAKGVIVKCNAQHLCMKMRGVEKQDSSTTTFHCAGLFADNADLRRDFFESLS